MLSVDEARALVLARTTPLHAERVPITGAHGRVLAEDLAAERAIPAFDNSAMDGVGVRAVDVATVPATLRVVSSALPGATVSERAIGAGECARVMTGAPIPPGVDAVVMREMTDETGVAADGTGAIVVKESAPVGQHVRKRGEDMRSARSSAAPGRA
jgi:molybdopterin molybdotransferase